MPFEELLKYPFVLLSGFLGAFVLTPMVIRLSRGLGLVDVPGGRRVHREPTPLGGGIAVFLGFHAACAALYLLPWAPFVGALDAAWWWKCFVLSGLLLGLGLADDAFDLRPGLKLAGQIAVALLAYTWGMRAHTFLGVELPVAVDVAATVFWFLLLINAFNLIDGLDGLASGLAVIASLGLAGSFLLRRQPADVLVLLGFAGACLGFLRYNFSPASVFLGDAGSMVLGFVLAAVAVSSGAKGTAMATIGLPLLAVGLPVLDTALAVWRRTARRLLLRGDSAEQDVGQGRVMTADSDHLHHRLLRAGLTPRRAASWLYGLSLALVAVGLLSMTFRAHSLGIYLLAFMAVTFVVVRHVARVELWDTGRAVVSGLSLPPGRVLPMLVYPLFDTAALAGALAVGLALAVPDVAGPRFKELWLMAAPLWVGVPLLCLFGARVYQRLWSLARVSEFSLLGAAVLVGTLLAAGLAGLIKAQAPQRLLVQVVVHGSLSLLLVGGVRALPRAVQDLMTWRHRGLRPSDAPRRHMLLVGAGPRAALFLIEQSMRANLAEAMIDIVGLVDEDRNLQGRYVHGCPVLGSSAALDSLLRERHVEDVVVTAPLPEPVLARVRDAAAAAGVRLLHWDVGLSEDGGTAATNQLPE